MLNFLFPKRNNLEEQVKFAIQKFISEPDDDSIFNALFQKTKDELLSCQLLVFIPIIVTREYYRSTEVKLSDHYSRNIGNGQSETVYYKDHPVYCQIQKATQKNYETLSSEDILKILGYSAEYKTLREAETQGLKIMSPPVLAMGNL